MEKTSQGKMSSIGVPSNEYLNTRTCVRAVNILRFPGPREGRGGCGTGMPHVNLGAARVRGAPTSRCLTPRRVRQRALCTAKPSGLCSLSHSQIWWLQMTLQKCVVVAAVESAPAVSGLHMNSEGFASAASAVFLQNEIFTIANISCRDRWNLLFSLQNSPFHRGDHFSWLCNLLMG